MTVGRVILVAGVLVLLFIPYLLWGTGLITAQAQRDLRQQFAASQRLRHQSVDVHPPSGPSGPPTVAPPITEPALGSALGIISIPKIALTMAIVEGTGADQLRSGPGHYPGTPLPGQAGNAAIAGHRTTYLHPFYDLDQLTAGDAIDIVTIQGQFVYKVIGSQVVAPSDVAVVAPTPTPVLTLTTCNPRYSASQRLVVQAALVADVVSGVSPTHVASAAQGTPVPKPTAPVALQRHWWEAVAWGLAVAALMIGVWSLALRLRGPRRVAVLTVGLALWLGVVFLFFGALAPLLPASY